MASQYFFEHCQESSYPVTTNQKLVMCCLNQSEISIYRDKLRSTGVSHMTHLSNLEHWKRRISWALRFKEALSLLNE